MTSGSPRNLAGMSIFKVVLLVVFATLLVMGTERADARKVSVETTSVGGEEFPFQKQDVMYVSHNSRKLAQRKGAGGRG